VRDNGSANKCAVLPERGMAGIDVQGRVGLNCSGRQHSRMPQAAGERRKAVAEGRQVPAPPPPPPPPPPPRPAGWGVELVPTMGWGGGWGGGRGPGAGGAGELP